ncbi:MAG TPA: serine/threonine-protein kinase [Nevskiaceae bacterium]|nr:serine/threonine-protein kinase [Nevskiaceae bacterium]
MKSLPCPPEHWPEFSRLLDEAFELPAGDREAWLGQLATRHAHLKPWLLGVLNADAQLRTGNFLDRPHFPTVGENDFAFEAGQPIGAYRLEAPLGRGGMGEVWKARRIDGALDRTVALKLPHFWIFASGMRQRLHRERDILASLTHPHIAQLHDAGVTGDGQPYLALELVDGTPIDEYCRAKGLTVEQRVVLFGQVLDAIRYAHSQLVVHRDLKPSNILVTTDGQVKLLDFGIAKLLDARGDGSATELTRLAGRALTPEYAAPEQIAGDPVSVATDVYALGVILFQLLAGKRPFGRERPVDVPIASASIHPEHIEDVRCANVRELRRLIEGDLDAILARCLALAPADRYPSVEQLAEDLERHRKLEPIRARRIGRMERSLRFVRRNRLAVGMSAALVLAVSAGITGIVLQTFRAQAAAVQARDQAKRADLTRNFLYDMLVANDTRLAGRQRRDVSAGELLDFGVDHIAEDFRDQPDTQIELLRIAATIYGFWGDESRMRELLRQRASVAEKAHGPLHPAAIQSLIEDVAPAAQAGDVARAERLLQDADDRLRRAGLDESEYRAQWWQERYVLLAPTGANHAAREHALREMIALAARTVPDRAINVYARLELANLLNEAARFSEARELAEGALEVLGGARRIDRRQAYLGAAYVSLAGSLEGLGEIEAAERAWRRAETPQADASGIYADDTGAIRAQHAWFLHQRGERERAARIFEEVLHDPPTAVRAEARVALELFYAQCLAVEGRVKEAVPRLEALRPSMVAASATLRADFLRILADAYDRNGRGADALATIDEAVVTAREAAPAGTISLLLARERRARLLLDRGQAAEAAAEFEAILAAAPSTDRSAQALALGGLARLAVARRDAMTASDLSRRAIETLERSRPTHDVRFGPYLWRVHADALALGGRDAEAQQWRARALSASRQYDDPSSPTTRDT